MITEIILFIVGIVLLIKGADFLVEGSSSLAKKLGLSTLVIGLTIVAFGTSTPELVVNIISAIKGSTEIAFGNIIGSNIANILLVLGIVSLIFPIKIESSTVWKQIPFSLLAALVLLVVSNYLLLDKIQINYVLRATGILFLCFFLIFLYYVFELAKKSRAKSKPKEARIKLHKNPRIFLLIAVGLAFLYLGGKWTVEGAIVIAEHFGLSQFLISATIVAIGTSLPELSTGILAAVRKREDIAVGGVIGSNIFNIFWILGITAVIAPIMIPNFISIDILFLVFSTLLLFAFMFVGKKHEIDRWQGIIFLLLYVAYIIFLINRG